MRSDRWAMRILFLDCSPSTKEGADAARRFVMARPDFPHNSARIGGLSRTSKERQGLNRNPKLPSSPQQLRQPTPLNAPTDKRWVAPISRGAKHPTSLQQPKQPTPLKAATDKRWVAPIAASAPWRPVSNVQGMPRPQQKTQASLLAPATQTAQTTQGSN